ncbi:flavodoxin domain protein [Campylobacter sp. FOBRC14]|nr:flavodoxin domain protein [Campylobacter sp. FOBRC14]
MDGYDVIFLGYPIWWSDLPMAVYTFLQSYDFKGKTIIPFATHEGSGLSGTDRNIAKATGAKVSTPLVMQGKIAQNSQDEAQKEVESWLKKLGFID